VPGILLTGIESEGDAGVERIGRILAEKEGCQRVAALDRPALHSIHNLQRRHEFAGSEQLDLELAVSDLADALAKGLAGPVQQIKALGPTAGESPPDGGLALGDGRTGDGACDKTGGELLQKPATFH